ncbi:hypothetical protein [Lactococcus lactis]|uniref:Uncharacterized protein n=1 Tax=Lactococcus lactis TaxID=1358 RepID=A0AAW5TJ99_9LACT|nr:hypothetical protein [Lactococcus lactis]MCW2281194.1 hypothetical protein [Lactococcus lactis]
MYIITLGTLRRLGSNGGATARLYDGSVYRLTPDCALSETKEKAIIRGEYCWVTIEKDFKELYPHIRTIQLQGQVIARRNKAGQLESLDRSYGKKVEKYDK